MHSFLNSELGTQKFVYSTFVVQRTKQHISCVKDILDMFIMGQWHRKFINIHIMLKDYTKWEGEGYCRDMNKYNSDMLVYELPGWWIKKYVTNNPLTSSYNFPVRNVSHTCLSPSIMSLSETLPSTLDPHAKKDLNVGGLSSSHQYQAILLCWLPLNRRSNVLTEIWL